MPRRPYGVEPDINLLRMALMEQGANTQPGRVPSGIAHNAYLGSIPNTAEQDREAQILAEIDRRFMQNREDERKRTSALDDVEAAASIRNFETRSGVRDMDAPKPPPVKAFTAENFRPMASHGPAPVEAAPESAPPMRTIRRFTSEGTKPVDPDAAMGARERARLDPRVMASENQLAGDLAIASAKGKESGPSAYSAERVNRTLQSARDLVDRVGLMTAGPGAALSAIPGTDARDFRADLDTLKANIAFGELTAMREASKTGGALGNVAIRELELLESALGALDQGQSPENLAKNLRQIEGSMSRWQAANGGGSQRPIVGGGGDWRNVDGYRVRERR